MDELRTPKAEIAFISSNCCDALGAKAFGFTVYWINRAGAPMDRMGLQLDSVISSLRDLDERMKA